MPNGTTTYTIIVVKCGDYYVDTDPLCVIPPVFCTLAYAQDFPSKEAAELYVEKYKENLMNPVEIQTLRFITEIVEHFNGIE